MEASAEYLIIGAGPAGLQLGYDLARKRRDYLILERASEPGSFFKTFPRHRRLLSINKLHTGIDEKDTNLRWDWNSLLSDSDAMLFKHYSRDYFPDATDLHRYLVEFARHFDIRARYDTTVTRICRENGVFVVTDAEGKRFTGKRLVVATGLSLHKPDIPGIELCEDYQNQSVDPGDYVNQRVLVVGKGNSAFETANNLAETAAAIHVCSPESVELAWRSHYVGHLRAINVSFLDTYQLKSQNAVLDAAVDRIERAGDKLRVHIAYSHAKGQTAVLSYDRVILCTGFRFDDSIFDETCRPDLAVNGMLPAQTSEWESTNVPGLFFAGTLMSACDRGKTSSGFIHGFRHNIRSLSNVFELKYHGTPWPCEVLEPTPEAVLGKVIERVNSDPAMFLQAGFLCDLVVISEEDGTARYYETMRRDYVRDSEFGKRGHYYTISVEYGKFNGDPFRVERDPSPGKAREAAYLHPVIRRYRRGALVAEHHVQDDVESQWRAEVYVKPALAFFERQLGGNRRAIQRTRRRVPGQPVRREAARGGAR